MNARKIITIAPICVIIIAAAGLLYNNFKNKACQAPIKVGILHSLSGTMAISETSVVDATLMAIDEINQKGGLLGKMIYPVIVDTRSDWLTIAKEAERLITEEKVSVVFGCWTSASRKTVKPVFEKYDHLLFYPVQYEGLEESPNIIYTGAAPNQQIIPAVKWCFDNIGKRFFLVGSDYIFPRAANMIIRDIVSALRGEIVGEEYIPLGSSDVEKAVAGILQTGPDVVLNTINGDTNIAFFRELSKKGITPDRVPTMSFSIGEDELRSIGGAKNMDGNYAAWNYFQSIDTEVNREFVNLFKVKYGQDRVISDPMEAGYFGVYIWARAVKDAGTHEVTEVRKAIPRQSFNAPGGMVYIDSKNNHTWKTVRIGKINKDGQFDIVWSSEKPIRPNPFPVYRTRSEWAMILEDLYVTWGEN